MGAVLAEVLQSLHHRLAAARYAAKILSIAKVCYDLEHIVRYGLKIAASHAVVAVVHCGYGSAFGRYVQTQLASLRLPRMYHLKF